MLADLVHTWLEEDGSYAQGLALYRQTGGAKPLAYFERQMSARYVNPAVKAELRAQLETFSLLNPPASSIKPGKAVQQMQEEQEAERAAQAEPEAILRLREKAIPFHKQYSHLKAELYAEAIRKRPSKRKLLVIAREIMNETLPKLDAIYDQIREWQRTGEVPDMPRPIIVEETVQKMLQVNSLRSRISHLRRRLKGQMEAMGRLQYENEIKEKEAALAELCAELGLNEE